MSKSKCTEHFSLAPLLEVEMSKKCTPLWREAHLEVKMLKTLGVWTTLGGSDAEKVHAIVARSTPRSQNVKNTWGVWTTFRGSDVASLRFSTLHYITLHSTTLHYTPLHYTTLHNTTATTTQLHSTILHYTPLHYITLYYTTLQYTTLHYTTLHCTSLHYTTLHSTTRQLQLHNYIPLRWTPLHSTTRNYITLHYTTLHYTPLHYITLHYLPLHFTTLHERSTLDRSRRKNRKTHWYEAVSAALNFPFWKEVSQNCFVSDVVKFKNWRSLAKLFRFGCCQVQNQRTFLQNSFVFKLADR